MSTTVPVALVDASNQLFNLGRPLTKIQEPASTLPPLSSVPGKITGFGDSTRVHRSVALSDAGEKFNMSRFTTEVYPIPAPLCERRGVETFGAPTRYDGRPVFLVQR
jgi:hypothetical protein